ncbi:ELWxxDGT repeat protein, partial [Glaesserella parasuis]|uniref:ELWxxDGT repeat protein n=1 Tax=Glaesserella parasuis TaxID=738 RepID=UPI003B79FB29
DFVRYVEGLTAQAARNLGRGQTDVTGEHGLDVGMTPSAGPGAVVRQLTPAGRRLFFTATSRAHGHELWVSEGTPETTRLVKDIRPGAEDGNLENLVATGERLWFTA